MEFHSLKGIIDQKYVEKACSRLIMGTAHFYQYDSRQQAFDMLDEYFKIGGNMFDMAHQYRDSEVIFGEWLHLRKNRSEVHILTKGAHHDDGEPGPRVNPAAISKDISESLERLNTDYIDFYALHRDDETVQVGVIMDALNQHLAAGQIHAIGASNWSHQRIQAANEYAAAHGLIGFTFNSPNLSLAKCREPRWPGCISVDEHMENWHKGSQMPLLSWSSQAGGFFSGRFAPDRKDHEEMVRVYYTEDNWKRYERAKKLAEEKGVTAIQIALAYVLNQPYPTAAIIGPENSEELMSSVAGSAIKLTAGEMNWLNLMEREASV
ncbi:aldo/keto reductase [Metabacillus dongyingensis]|uniref:aldo/keto reductase n=1 Tax=Metabacillus dongyingensis TaxID=2874282 RepID=UPI003B8B1E25